MEPTTEQAPVDKTINLESNQPNRVQYSIVGFFTVMAICVGYLILNVNTFINKSVPDEIKIIINTYNEKLQSGDLSTLNSLAYQEDQNFLKEFESLNEEASKVMISDKVTMGAPSLTSFSREMTSSRASFSDTIKVSLQSRLLVPLKDGGESFKYLNESFTFIKTKDGYKISKIVLDSTNEESGMNEFKYSFFVAWMLLASIFLGTTLFYVTRKSNVKTYWLFVIFLVPFGMVIFWIIRPYRNLIK